MKIILSLLLSLIIYCVTYTQAPEIEWQNTIGGDYFDELYSIEQTYDGGYILGGSSASGISGDKTEDANNYDYWVIKLDTIGNIEWQNTIGGTDNDYLYSIHQTFCLSGVLTTIKKYIIPTKPCV